jgi:hypothetical protein|tara:strand:- start:1549 stop:1716 length:168 start_codon:yes stop_codon:yes gene_type:complete
MHSEDKHPDEFIIAVKSIDILKKRMEEYKDMPVPDVKDLWKYRRFRKVKLNKNEY